MKLYTKAQLAKLKKNGSNSEKGKDHFPVVKWFTPFANATWLITEILDEETAFGLCDLGLGFPELGHIHIPEILELTGPGGLKVERDYHFEGNFPLSVYSEAARSVRMIVTQTYLLEDAQQKLKIEDQ